MTYLSWSLLCEGNSDKEYYEALVPRMLADLIANAEPTGGLPEIADSPAFDLAAVGRDREIVARYFCKNHDAVDLVFVHADRGGRGVEGSLSQRGGAYCDAFHEMCGWDCARCIVIAPHRETEAWVLADPESVCRVLGYRGRPEDLGLPSHAAAAETVPDPKDLLAQTQNRLPRRRARRQPTPGLHRAVANDQPLDALRRSRSFVAFETKVRRALESLRIIGPAPS